jgi:membrane protease subunit (stomatin/prohibitin family)
MGLFGLGKGKSGGLMNVIRCDEQEYLVWKWRPEGQAANSTSRENSIRYGSSLRVKDGEVAVFVYKQKDSGTMQDFIVGPYDDTIKTANFPILSSIVGLAFGGESPFQAEVYFINLAGIIQIKFAVPYFDVYDPRFLDFAVPMSARGTITFQLEDYKSFIKLHRLIDFDLESFKRQVKDMVVKYVKGFITNVPSAYQIPVLQIERKVMDISDMIGAKLAPDFTNDFGVKLKRFDLSTIEPDKESDGYAELRRMTAGQQAKTIEAQTDINIKNMQDTQRINAQNMEETLRIQREESQRAQRLQTETNFIGAHALDQQADVLKTGAQNLGQMGAMNMGAGGGSGMNPAGVMMGMAMGGAMGQQMAGMMNQMGNAMNGQMNTPPPPPSIQYNISVNGQQAGPFNMNQLQQLVQQGQLTPQTYVWKQGMAGWEMAGNVAELGSLFQSTTPPPPPPPMS